MNESQFPFSIMSSSKINNDESSESSIDGDNHFKLKSFMKFKPKLSDNNKEKENNSLKGAESKVMSILSDYLKNFELEKKNKNTKNIKHNYKFSSNIRKTKKRRNTVMTNLNLQNNFKFKIDEDNNRKVSSPFNTNQSKNIDHLALITSFSQNKKGFKKKSLLKHTNANQFINNNVNQKTKMIKEKINEKKSFKKKAPINTSKEEKSINKDSLNKTDSISMKIDNLKKDSFTNLKNISQNISNDNINHQNIKNERLFNRIFQSKSSKSRNILFNDSSNNSILSEGSEYCLIQKSFEVKNEPKNKALNTSNKQSFLSSQNISIIKKKNSMQISNIDYNNFFISKKSLKYKKSNSISSEHSRKSEKSKFISNKFFRGNAKFKSLKEKLKETIIIRPEDIESALEKHKRRSTNKKATTDKNEIFNKNETNRINSLDNNKTNFSQMTKGNENETNQALKTSKINNSEITKKEINNLISNNTIKTFKTLNYEKYRNLYYKQNIYDSLDDDEIEDQDDDNYMYIDPNSKFSLIFDSLLFIVSIIFFVESPLYLAMTHSFCREKKLTIMFLFNLMVDILFIIDLFLGFFRAYYNWEEQLVCKHKFIIKKYLGEWFIFDLIAAIPIYYIYKINEPYCNDLELTHSYYNVILDKLHYLFLCNKLFKVIKVNMNNQALKYLSNRINEKTKMIFLFFLVIFFLNYSACVYIFVARNSYPNWILQANLGTYSFQHIYICSIYILIMAITTVGYGDITCYSFNERIYQLFLLVVGILAYSYAVSAVSNYVQKINEKSADFTKKKSILDEIRLSNPNLPEDLYERILRHLIYKNIHEKKLKNLIFDCLPVSLKNDLISEMYKPIIKNFIFFKNFQNKDFIVRVILAFKAIIAYKNDILVTEGDMIEDIIFVKKGVLSVELPINITNPQENIDKYINIPLLQVRKERNIEHDLNEGNTLNQTAHKLSSLINNSSNKNLQRRSSALLGLPNFENTKLSTHIYKTPINLKEKKEEEEEIRYVKILGIRNNEHFGDVLIFLEQRSPLRLRVRSKKCELFFLKKIDAINISNSHPNIWRRINKKSIYNFKQIQKCIIRIVEIYTSVKRIRTKKGSIFKVLGNKKSSENTKNNKIKNLNSSNSNLPPIKEVSVDNKRHSLDFRKESIFNNIFKEKKMNVNMKEYKNIKIKKKFFSAKNNIKIKLDEQNVNKTQLLFNSSTSSSIQNSKKSKNSCSIKNNKSNEEKLIDLYYGNYKYYKGMNKHSTQKKTIISEQPSFEETLTVFNSNKKKTSIDDNHFIQKGNNNNIESNNKNSSCSSKTLKMKESYSLHYFKGENNELINNDDESESSITSGERIVNKEINPGEEITMNNDKVLFDNTYNNSSPKNELNKDLHNNIEYKNSKIQVLLNSLIKENDKSLIEREESNEINNNNNEKQQLSNTHKDSENRESSQNNDIYLNNYIISNKHILSSINSQNSLSNEKETDKKAFNNDILSVNQNISFEYKSYYENCNLIAGEKLINNKSFQDKLKKFLKTELLALTNYSSGRNKKVNSLIDSTRKEITKSRIKFQSTINRNNKGILNALSLRNSPISNRNKKSKIKKVESVFEPKQEMSNSRRRGILRTSSYSDNNLLKNKIKNKYDMNIDNNSNKRSPKIYKGRKSFIRNRFLSRQDLLYSFGRLDTSSKDLKHRKFMSRKSWHFPPMSPHLKIKKKKNDLLSQIDLNIEKTNQNLNNPDQFYSNYFNYLLEEKINYSGYFGKNTDDDNSKLKREKTMKIDDTLRKDV